MATIRIFGETKSQQYSEHLYFSILMVPMSILFPAKYACPPGRFWKFNNSAWLNKKIKTVYAGLKYGVKQ